MNEKILLVGAAALVIMAGCQNTGEQLGAKMAEGLINSATGGEVKVNFDDVKNGNINVTAKDGGTLSLSGDGTSGGVKVIDSSGKTMMEASGDEKGFTMKDESGKTIVSGNENSMTVSGKDGKTTYKSDTGNSRPADAPADMPSLDGANNFTYLGLDGMVSLIFKVDNSDLKATCNKETALLMAAGWKASSSGFSMETSDSIITNYEMGGNMMSLSCNTYEGNVTVALQKTKKSS